MNHWDETEVSDFLGVRPQYSHAVHYQIPLPAGPAMLTIDATSDSARLESYSGVDGESCISSYIHCDSVAIKRDNVDEGGNCLVLSGRGGHVTIRPGSPYFHVFFSMHGFTRGSHG